MPHPSIPFFGELQNGRGGEMERLKEDLVGEWLEELGMSQYKQVFRDAGVFDLESVMKLTQESLSDTLGIQRKDHKNKLALGIRKLVKGVTPSFLPHTL